MDKKFGFWTFCRENSFGIFVIMMVLICFIFGALGGVGPCAGKAKAECITHTVSKGETLGKISEQYFGDRNSWKDIKWQNELKRNWVKEGQELHIYVPNKEDWWAACATLVYLRMEQLKLDQPYAKLAEAIANGIDIVSTNELSYTPIQKLEACRWAITTAHQESMFEFAIGGAGEVGMYQFKLNTVRLTGRWYELAPMAAGTDADLVLWLLGPTRATEVFLLHYAELYKRYKGRWMAWKRYNNGSEAAAYASKAVKRYWEVRRLQPIRCKP